MSKTGRVYELPVKGLLCDWCEKNSAIIGFQGKRGGEFNLCIQCATKADTQLRELVKEMRLLILIQNREGTFLDEKDDID